MYELTGFQRDLLFVVNSLGPSSGQEIREALETSQGREIRHTRLYANLDTLVSKGFVEKTHTGGRTNEYEPTSDGRQIVHARIEWEEQYLTQSAG